MARISGVDLPNKKRAESGLTYDYGVVRTPWLSLLRRAGTDRAKGAAGVTAGGVKRRRRLIENERGSDGALPKGPWMNVKRLIERGSYRGLRHRRGLQVRG